MPFLLEAAAVLATFVHPNHIVCLCSWGLTYLPPSCNSKLFGGNQKPSLFLLIEFFVSITGKIPQ
ncbi:hypothetical protein BVJ62_00450 [Vibrio cholerae]|nr:hypothetical protein [Vibrio cholerae]MCD1195955.1 hypothetical protein [Vibrio cholerae]MCD1200129.1 hypothetical protein [Vibrio cholerae]MCD1244539.1 hypothetical protein [Vibrio cholerae]MCD1246761.1 hypothetical protein [Vibrio cholerae]